jgi:type VI secretion system VasD/TssJ family lipoprotein
MKVFRHIVLLAATCLLVACAAEPEPPMPVNKTLSVQAGPNVNQYNNAANPIVVRLYQLSSRSEFEAADFWGIFNDNAPDLAGVVLDKRSLSPLYPGETRLVAFDLPIDTESLDNGVTISVTSSGVSIQFRNPVDETEDAEEKKKGFGLLAWLFGGGK